MWTFRNAAPYACADAHLVGQQLHGSLVELRVGACEVDEVGGVDRERRDPVVGEARAEGRQLVRQALASVARTWGCR